MAAADASDGAAVAAAPPLPAPPTLWQRVTERYDAAQRDAAATMTDTNTELVPDGGLQFVLRVAAKLRDKPKPPPDASGEAKKEWRNPFLPYDRALWVADLGASHVLLLNKFNIVPWHCLVVTAEFRSQLDDLDAADLAATWVVVQAMPRGGLAFYNCGPVSGASQPHKHVQVVPLPLDDPEGSGSDGISGAATSDQQGLARPPIWQAVAAAAAAAGAQPGQPFEMRNLPYAAFAATLPPLQQADAAGPQLEAVYKQLLARCIAFVKAQTGRQGATPQDSSLSYNWVCTRDFMLVAPRRQEAEGPVSCNSVAFAGSIFVRSREEQQFVRERGPLHVLTATGFSW
ncbi:hypothetical protein COHA_005137 [Chlorella ohadii]|uniref:ATP adenylyltransferase n=1 Tax=Chlorella ohadii TaxID=2649997 RepID=A0AAD5DRX5_9CHLO|nr:hypothetical protein COHA_005137 [Chlorella ohadii]